eukprot:CAMPEP_0198734158 /NCGR_PEP_ID=MMETSP1475-20131203/50773_1 /TAXON_ID= ORGANISM="Unidentified sp., Strain CCMP1999" /NCGR_SAMPLE_ID=MMETSP1475 /ASSEMBLY_ACC=CAM_ASM_001111 /LENGTH=230 /DNA_ID=CAMNT_0044497575 /DNA_START=537 /DNA_END=1226 /DNA_ORIENTATION=+
MWAPAGGVLMGMVAQGDREGSEFTETFRWKVEKDCDTCTSRNEPCRCSISLAQRRSESHAIDYSAESSVRSIMLKAMSLIQGVSNVRFPFEARLRMNVDPFVVHSKVQSLLIMRGPTALSRPECTISSTHAIANPGTASGLFCESPSMEKSEGSSQRKTGLTCSICNAQFQYPYRLKRHIEGVHKLSRNFRCEICDKLFSQNAHLQAHERNVHQKASDVYCSLCGKKFAW